MEGFTPKVRVNGGILPQFDSQGVVLLGKVTKVDPSGNGITLEASDGKSVAVVFDQPIMENLEGLLEAHGTCHGNKLHCQTYYMLPPDMQDKFDMAGYEQAVQLIHSEENDWRL